jgi:hypothetical protein
LFEAAAPSFITPITAHSRRTATGPPTQAAVASIFAGYCEQLGLEVLEQRLHGKAEGRHMDGLDCVTLFRKPFQE